MVTQCCKCKKVRASNAWHTPAKPLIGPVSHTYCPVCFVETQIEFFSQNASRAGCTHASTAAHVLLAAHTT